MAAVNFARLARPIHRQPDGKRAAFARLALQRDAALVRGDDAVRQRQAQADTLESTAIAHVELREGSEKKMRSRGRNADAGIGDADDDVRSFPSAGRLRRAVRADHDTPASAGKL